MRFVCINTVYCVHVWYRGHFCGNVVYMANEFIMKYDVKLVMYDIYNKEMIGTH